MKRILSALGIASALVLVGGVAVASIPDSSGVIHGCRKTSNGDLTVIDSATQTCPAGTVALNWAVGPPAGTLYGLHHLSETFDLQVSSAHQTFFVDCPSGELAVSAASNLYRVNGADSRAEPPTEIAAYRVTFSLVNPYDTATQLQAGYNCAKVTS